MRKKIFFFFFVSFTLVARLSRSRRCDVEEGILGLLSGTQQKRLKEILDNVKNEEDFYAFRSFFLFYLSRVFFRLGSEYNLLKAILKKARRRGKRDGNSMDHYLHPILDILRLTFFFFVRCFFSCSSSMSRVKNV